MITVWVLAISMATRPAARCPERWYVDGVRPSGIYACRPVLGDPDRDVEDARARREVADERVYTGAIYCTGGAHPVVRGDGRSVGCQR